MLLEDTTKNTGVEDAENEAQKLTWWVQDLLQSEEHLSWYPQDPFKKSMLVRICYPSITLAGWEGEAGKSLEACKIASVQCRKTKPCLKQGKKRGAPHEVVL